MRDPGSGAGREAQRIEAGPSFAFYGVDIRPELVAGKTTAGEFRVVPRHGITRYAIRAVKSRARTVRRVIGSLVLFAGAGLVFLDAIDVVRLPRDAILGGSGFHWFLIIAMGGGGARVFSTAWDPMHVLYLTIGDGEVGLLLSPSPPPFKLMEAADRLKEHCGVVLELYPED